MSRFFYVKEKLKVGMWYVRTMTQDGRLEQVERLFMEYGIDILALSETRWNGINREVTASGNVLISCGRDDGIKREGVSLLLSKNAAKALTEWNPINSRILLVRLKSQQCNLSIVVCYAPHSGTPEDVKDSFYETLQDTIDSIAKRDMTICLGDFNSKVGSDNGGYESVMGRHGLGEVNENGARLISFCAANNLVIGGTLFQHKDIHKYTWTSPDGKHHNQIDHIMISKERRKSMLDVRTWRGADIGSDHQLVTALIQLKLKANNKKSQGTVGYDTRKLLNRETNEQFVIECRNRFSVLDTISEQEKTIDEDWKDIKEVYQKAGKEVLGTKRMKQKVWISDTTWSSIERRKAQKGIVDRFRGSDDDLRTQVAIYSSLNSEVKRSARQDKRAYMENLANEAEHAMMSGTGQGVSMAYKAVNEIAGIRKKGGRAPVRNANGVLITSEEHIKERWCEHFKLVMNKSMDAEDLNDPIIIPEPEEEIEVTMNEITMHEMKRALKKLKNWKAPGPDGITSEMLKADEDGTAQVMLKFIRRIWDAEMKPQEWECGTIIKIPKKGDLKDCGNWRGITLTSIVGKLLSLIVLQRIQDALDRRLRDEQAGFRKARGCSDQIFVIRHIIQQCVEFRVPLLMAFVDFEKAFDSVHRPALWKILRSYGLPDKYVRLIEEIHKGSRCRVNVDGQLSPEFSVESGVLQGNVLSPLLFAILIDFIMRRTVGDKEKGIQWVDGKHLADLDYADDIALLSNNINNLQELLDKLKENGRKVGLKINARKTEIMRTEHAQHGNISLNDQIVNNVSNFKYLGTVVSDTGSLEAEFSERLKKANQIMGMLSKIWKSHRLTMHVKLRIYSSLVRSVLIYGHESWYDNDTISRRFLVFENKALRRILGIRWQDRVRNVTIREVTQVPYIDETLMRDRWRWMGHIHRTEPDRIIREAARWEPVGTRRIGRPRPTWRRTMQREAGDTFASVSDEAQDRGGWRNYVEALCVARRWRR